MSEEKMRDVVAAHIEDLRKTAIVIDSFPDFAATSAEIRKAADELEAALQESDGRTQLEEFGMKVANEIAEHYGYSLLTEKALHAIVTNLIGAAK